QLTGFQEYVVPGTENQLHDIFRALSVSVGTKMHSVISITAGADGTVIYYDHWENGYAADPTQADEIFVLNAGQSLILESSNIDTPRNAAQTCTSNQPGSKFRYDGG